MANPTVIPYGQFGQPQPSSPGFPTFPSYALPSHHQLMQLTGPTVNGVTTAPATPIQAPYPTGKLLINYSIMY